MNISIIIALMLALSGPFIVLLSITTSVIGCIIDKIKEIFNID